MDLVTGCQPLPQGEALALFRQDLRGVGISQAGEFGLMLCIQFSQLLAVAPSVHLPCG